MNIQEQIDLIINEINNQLSKSNKIIQINIGIDNLYHINMYKNNLIINTILICDTLDECLSFLSGYLSGILIIQVSTAENVLNIDLSEDETVKRINSLLNKENN